MVIELAVMLESLRDRSVAVGLTLSVAIIV